VNFVFRICQLAALVLMLSGCEALQISIIALETAGALTTHVVTSPGVLCSTEDSIGVTYLIEEPNDQHAEAMQLISAHCINGYIETKRVDYAGSRHVYATCLQADGSPAVSEPCEYASEEDIGFGQSDVTRPDGYP
jgi:hypothetical protein